MPTADSIEKMALAAAAKKKSAADAAAAKKKAAAAASKANAASAAKAKAAVKNVVKKPKPVQLPMPIKATKPVGMPLNGGLVSSPESNSLYVDPTPAYQPALDYLATQTKAANDRYKVNKENISNIFGDLAGLAEKDAVRIREQFTTSIANQQLGLANRTAEVRSATAAGEAQAAATGAERGQGPAMAVNPIAVAAEQGIARSNEYQTTWQALQEANQQQAQTDITTRGAGYGQQEAGAIQQLAQGLEDKLIQLAGNTAQVQSDIAAARIAGQQTVAQANYGEIQTAKQQQAALAQAKVAANARIAAANAAAAAKKAAANAPKEYSKTYSGWKSKVIDLGISPADITGDVKALVNDIKTKTGTTPTSAQILAAYKKKFPGEPTIDLVTEYVKNYR